jgi:hypothetical protein
LAAEASVPIKTGNTKKRERKNTDKDFIVRKPPKKVIISGSQYILIFLRFQQKIGKNW